MGISVKFSTIVADPPWSFDDKLARMRDGGQRSADSKYPTLTVSAIADLPVADVADPDGCVLALWVPSALLADGLCVLAAWGFSLKQTFVWVKTKREVGSDDPNDDLAFGMGRLFRNAHEIALIGTSGRSVYPSLQDRSQRTVVLAPNGGHSSKPEELQDRLETMFPGSTRLEMFARRSRSGWTCLGNEIDDRDIRDSLLELSLSPLPSSSLGS